MRVFISYKRESQPFAETLRQRLLAWGHTTWMDVHNIPKGEHWPDAIDAGLNDSDVVVGVMTPEAMASRNVKNEWDWAIVNDHRLILLMVEKCRVHMNYVSLNYVDFTRDTERGFADLQAALANAAPGQPPPAPGTPAGTARDPYADYLRARYDFINDFLARSIIPRLSGKDEAEVIPLVAERERGAVDVLFEQRDEIDPFLELNLDDAPAAPETFGDFAGAFAHFGGRVLLMGAPGAGKTTTLMHFARDMIVRQMQDRSAPVPILATIPTCTPYTPLVDWLAGVYGAPPDAHGLIERGEVLLLLDGLDELGGERPVDPNNPDGEKYDPAWRSWKR